MSTTRKPGNSGIAAVQVGSNVYTNVTLSVTPANIVSIGGQLPQESTLYAFSGGASPQAPLIQAKDRAFYGTTAFGGTHGAGSVFKITLQGAETQLYSFIPNSNADGNQPVAGLIQASDNISAGLRKVGVPIPRASFSRSLPPGPSLCCIPSAATAGIANSSERRAAVGISG